jgi:hypothetical protein
MTAPLKADVTAADRLLKAAIRRAREVIADAPTGTVSDWTGRVHLTFRDYDQAAVVAMLTAAGTAAELLLGEGS